LTFIRLNKQREGLKKKERTEGNFFAGFVVKAEQKKLVLILS